MRKTFGIFCMLAVVMLLAACGDGQKAKVYQFTGIPFISEGDSAWSMMSADGKVIFNQQINNTPFPPFLAFDNRFFVEEENGLYALYTCEETPVKVDSSFSSVCSFVDGKALVSKPGSYIQMIDVNGTVLRTLDKISGKEVEKARITDDGHIRFMTIDHCYGLLDSDCNVVFEPVYSLLEYVDGIVITSPESDKMFAEHRIFEKMTFHVCNLKGKEFFSIEGSQYVTSDIYGGKYIEVYKTDLNKNEKKYGLFDLKGEPVVKPSKRIRQIADFRNEEFVFFDGDKYGLMNTEGKVILEPDFDKLWFFGDNLLLAGESDSEDNIIGTLIDNQGKQVSSEEFLLEDEFIDFSRLDGKHALMHSIEKGYVLVNKDGTLVEDAPEFISYSLSKSSDNFVTNHHVDVQAFADHLNISLKGCAGLSLTMTPGECVNKKKDELTKWFYQYMKTEEPDATPKNIYDFLERNPVNEAESYKHYLGQKLLSESKDSLIYATEYNGVNYLVLCSFPDSIVKANSDSFVNNPMSETIIYVYSDGKNKNSGYLRQFYKAFVSRIRPLAKVIMENDNYLCVASETENVRTFSDGEGVAIIFERLSKGAAPDMKKITEESEKVADAKEDCAVEISE